MSLGHALFAYLFLVNLMAFMAYGRDKKRAILGLRRIPEKDLLLLGLIGGSAGAFAAQEIYRHKTRKASFRARFWTIAVVQLSLAVVALYLAVHPSSSSSP